MTSKTFFYQFLVTTTVVTASFMAPAQAADVTVMDLPAVSAFNGKIEAGGGFADLHNTHSTGLFYGAGSLSMPLGQRFGLQADLSVVDTLHTTAVGGGAHLFMRDPNSYLIGAVGGVADAGPANVAWIGGEGELYMGNMSVELLGGYMGVKPNGSHHSNKAFVIADLGYYATDNFRLTLGASSIAGFDTGHVGFEYMLDSSPFSITGDVRAGEHGFVAAKVGGTFYFGGNEPNKTLIRRHREDDPRNRMLDIFGAGGAAFKKKNSGTPPVVVVCDPEAPGFDPELCGR